LFDLLKLNHFTKGNLTLLSDSTDSSDPQSCDPGKYCETEGLAAPTGDCLAGYYCVLKGENSFLLHSLSIP